MKFILFLVFLTTVYAQELTFSAGKDNIVHEVASDVLKKAYKKINITPHFIFIPLEKSLQLSNSGQTDGEIARISVINRNYTNLIKVPVVINFVEGVAFGKGKHMHINKWRDLKPYRLGIAKGAKFIEKGTQGMNVTLYKGFHESFEALDKDEIDIAIVPKTTGKYLIYKNGYKDIHSLGKTLQRLNLYHFLHKKNAYLVPLLTPILQKMKKSGEIKYIREYYLQKQIQ